MESAWLERNTIIWVLIDEVLAFSCFVCETVFEKRWREGSQVATYRRNRLSRPRSRRRINIRRDYSQCDVEEVGAGHGEVEKIAAIEVASDV